MNALAHVLTPFGEANVRMVMRDGEPWWVGIDVVAALGIVKVHQALTALEDYERGTYIIGTPSGDQPMIIINESGFYSLLFKSRKPIAARFKRWLTCEVLPSIRKHGCYPPPPEPAPLAIDTETHEDGRALTMGQRLRSELSRWEAEYGEPFPICKAFSVNVIRSIEAGTTRTINRAAEDYLINRGLDVLYIRNGHRRLTDREFELVRAYRAADPAARPVLLQSAFALPGPVARQLR